MSSAIGAVIIASAQSVGKVFVIGGVGYLAVLYPQKAPFLPRQLVGNVARFTFHALTIPLIYSTIAVAVTIETVGNYWFVIVGAFCVMGTSYVVATLLRHLGCLQNSNPQDLNALRVAATFPNIVALPILIFPSLCEFPVVYEGFISVEDANAGGGGEEADAAYLERQCVAQSTTMIFCYFFSWSLAFWSFGNPQLMQAANQRHHEETNKSAEAILDAAAAEATRNGAATSAAVGESVDGSELVNPMVEMEVPECQGNVVCNVGLKSASIPNGGAEQENSKGLIIDAEQRGEKPQQETPPSTIESPPSIGTLKSIWNALKLTISSPGFIAMALAFVTACIPPLQKALFEGGGPLRFLGSAMETLGTASSPISTMVVAASLVPPRRQDLEESDAAHDESDNDGQIGVVDENPGMVDPNFGPYQRRRQSRGSRFHQIRRSLRSSSIRILHAIPRSRPEMMRLHIWFCLSRLILTPAVIVGLILALDCNSGALTGVPNLAKLVIIVNSALPGALIVIVLLKSNEEMAETAAAVAKVYMPSYLLSIFTIAAWTAVGLWVTLPDEDGLTVCQR